MGLPNIKDLVLAINRAITSNDWNTNWQKIVNWLTDGKTDINVKNITVATGGQIENNGSFTQNGNLTVTGDLAVSQNVNVDGKITGDGSGLYNLVSQGVQAFTPFSVNSGYVNSGNGDLISATPVSEGGNITRFDIVFKVDDGQTYGAIKATTANGSTFVLEQLNSDKLASNGTFYYFIGQGQTATIRLPNITIYRQPTQPASSINDVWLDTSKEELISYKCNDNGIWERWDYVPIGKVVVANIGTPSATATVTTFLYNQNGYTVNTSTPKNYFSVNGITAYALSHISTASSGVVKGTFNVPYIVWCSKAMSGGDVLKLQVSPNNSDWTIMQNFEAEGSHQQTVCLVVDKNLYFKVDGATYNYAPLYEDRTNYLK